MLSIVIPVLNSHEAIRRQVLYLARIMPRECELIVVDDGSDPPLDIPAGILIRTNDFRPWTQPRARNIGAKAAKGERLLFLDVDQILGAKLIDELLRGEDRTTWKRWPALLDEFGNLQPATGGERAPADGVFAIAAQKFHELGGFDEQFCGEYGFDDVEFLRRFEASGGQTVVATSPGYYWAVDVPRMHTLDRTLSNRNAVLIGGGT